MARLPVLLRWLAESEPDVACLRNSRRRRKKFPERTSAMRLRRDQARSEKLERGSHSCSRARPNREPTRKNARRPGRCSQPYIEATVEDLTIGCLYLPNGNPAPDRNSTTSCAGSSALRSTAGLVKRDTPVVPRRRLQRDATTSTSTTRALGDDALFRPEVRAPIIGCSNKAGPTLCVRSIQANASIPSGTISATPTDAMRGCASIICFSTARAAPRLRAAGVDRTRAWLGEDERSRARRGLSFAKRRRVKS